MAVLADLDPERCIRLSVQNAAENVKYHLFRRKGDRSTVVIVSEPSGMRGVPEETVISDPGRCTRRPVQIAGMSVRFRLCPGKEDRFTAVTVCRSTAVTANNLIFLIFVSPQTRIRDRKEALSFPPADGTRSGPVHMFCRMYSRNRKVLKIALLVSAHCIRCRIIAGSKVAVRKRE